MRDEKAFVLADESQPGGAGAIPRTPVTVLIKKSGRSSKAVMGKKISLAECVKKFFKGVCMSR